jgi:hypothetical protein
MYPWTRNTPARSDPRCTLRDSEEAWIFEQDCEPFRSAGHLGVAPGLDGGAAQVGGTGAVLVLASPVSVPGSPPGLELSVTKGPAPGGFGTQKELSSLATELAALCTPLYQSWM